MNLTKCFVAGLCLMAMTASAGVGLIKTNSFENGEANGNTDWWVGDGDTLTTRRVLNDDVNARTNYLGARPMTNAANEYVLKLNTEGAVWTNVITGASFAGTTKIYADMLVKFVPSETLPTLVSEVGGAKLALAIKADAGGTNYLNIANNDSTIFTWSPTTQEISTSAWYRVTVELYEDGGWTYGKVYINSSLVGNAITLNGEKDLTAIAFQGTGFIDEVVVRDDDPFGGGPLPAVVQLTLSFTIGELSVLVSGTGTNAAPVVPSGTTLDVIASTFYQIAGKSATNEWTSGGVGQTNGTLMVTADADATVTFTAQPWTSTNVLGAGASAFANAPATNVAAWAIANGVSALSDGIYTNYLYNIDDAAPVPELLIKSVAVTNTTVTVTVGAGTNNLSIINGILKLKAWPVLGGTPVTYLNEVPIAGTTNVTVQVDISTNKFVKALIE